jgi:hypothetical protein
MIGRPLVVVVPGEESDLTKFTPAIAEFSEKNGYVRQ